MLTVTLSNRIFASSNTGDVPTKKKTANIMKRKSEKRRREKKRYNRRHNAHTHTHEQTTECIDPYIIIAEAIIK
jgi:hypothetical protein